MLAPPPGHLLHEQFPPDRSRHRLLVPLSVDEWLPERHLARFAVEVVEGRDLRAMTGSYRGSGEASYHHQLLIDLNHLWLCHRRVFQPQAGTRYL
jgi:hypothetical protein